MPLPNMMPSHPYKKFNAEIKEKPLSTFMTKILFYMSTTLKEYLLYCFVLVILFFILQQKFAFSFLISQFKSTQYFFTKLILYVSRSKF